MSGFCGSDHIARGCADALREASKRVPEHIVGVDNGMSWVEASRPPPTTIDLNLGELRRLASAACYLVIRQSTEASLIAIPGEHPWVSGFGETSGSQV